MHFNCIGILRVTLQSDPVLPAGGAVTARWPCPTPCPGGGGALPVPARQGDMQRVHVMDAS